MVEDRTGFAVMTKNKLISAYTPSNTDPQLLKRVFVQREQLLVRIVDRLSVSMTSGDKHHLLLVGPRGSGKTHLITLAHWELRQNPNLSDSMRIAWLGEDDTFSGLIHFAFGIARSLADEYPAEFPADFKSSVRGLSPDDAALAVLNSVITNLKHRHLLLITENLDHTFQGLGESGQKKLRAFLQETRRIATLATTQQLFAGVSSRDEAFFGFFDTFHLEPLSVDDAQQLILNIAKEQGNIDLIQFLNSNNARYRIRALHHLAGGNHRMYVLLAEFLTQDKLNDLVAAFENLTEEMTPYFQERMRSLPDQQRQLVQCLCDAEGAMTVKQLVEETFIAEGNCSKQLGNLKAKAYVRSERRGKESYYDMAEPLMRLCLEVKNQRGRPLKLVASFLKAWFPEEKLQASLKAVGGHSRVAEYCQLALQCDQSIEALLNSKLKAEIEQKIDAKDWARAMTLAEELAVSEHYEGLEYRAYAAFQLTDLSSTIAALDGIIGAASTPVDVKARALFNRDITYGQFGDTHAALMDYTKMIQMPNAPADEKSQALLNRGVTYGQLGDTQAALTDFTTVLQIPDAPADQKATALLNRGITYNQLGDAQPAVADYTTFLQILDAPADQQAKALLNRGATYGQLGEFQAALADYTTLIQMLNGTAVRKARAFFYRANAYARLGDSQAALADYKTLLQMPDLPVDLKVKALLNRGVTYSQLGDTQAALEDFTTLLQMEGGPADERVIALLIRGDAHWHGKNWRSSGNDFEAVLTQSGISSQYRTLALFLLPEPMVAYETQQRVVAALKTAFEEGDKTHDDYGGTPGDLISMIVQRGPSEWAGYVSSIAPLYLQYGVAEKLGKGITQSIKFLDEGDFSRAQLDLWYQAWAAFGDDADELQIPLQCLHAAIEVLKSDPPNDRPLFRLPFEIRQLVRPLLQKKLNVT